MSKTEMLRKSSAQANENHIEQLKTKIIDLRNRQLQSVEELADLIDPLALALAQLTEESYESIQQIVSNAKQINQRMGEIQSQAQQAVDTMQQSASIITLKVAGIAAAAALVATLVTSGLFAWADHNRPPAAVNLDPQVVATYLAPAIQSARAAQRHSSNSQ